MILSGLLSWAEVRPAGSAELQLASNSATAAAMQPSYETCARRSVQVAQHANRLPTVGNHNHWLRWLLASSSLGG
jgi:hypothetical protein